MKTERDARSKRAESDNVWGYTWESFAEWMREYWRLKLLIPGPPNHKAPKFTVSAIEKAQNAWSRKTLPSQSVFDHFSRYVLWLQSLEIR